MLNITDKTIIVSHNFNQDIEKSLNDAVTIVKHIHKSNKYETDFLELIGKTVFKDIKFKDQFYDAALNYSQNKDAPNIYDEYFGTSIFIHNSSKNSTFKRITKIFLLCAWKNGFILLPSCFDVGGLDSFSLAQFRNPLYIEFEKIFQSKPDTFKSNVFSSLRRIIWSSNYKTIKDADFDELIKLQVADIQYRNGRTTTKVFEFRQIQPIFFELKKRNEDFSLFEPSKYNSWLAGYYKRYKEFDYKDYLNNTEHLKEYRRTYNNADAKLRARLKKQDSGGSVNLKRYKQLNEEEKSSLEKPATLEDELFQILANTKYGWRIFDFNYLEHPDIKIKNHELWIKVFNAFLQDRKKAGYETQDRQIQAINFLFHYIFFYLNKWSALNPNIIQIPTSPKMFKRSLFFKRTITKNDENIISKTFVELIEQKTDNHDVRNGFLHTTSKLFEFIEGYFSDDSDVWDALSKNPFNKMDLYILKRGVSKKTNKEIIPKKIYPVFKQYLYALEKWGEEFSILVNNKTYQHYDFINCNFLETSIPPISFSYQNKDYSIRKIPHIFPVLTRRHKNGTTTEIKQFVHLTVLRAFILALHTGLRMAQVRWLDRRTWDETTNGESQKMFYKININTDKFKNDEWKTYVPHQVRELLLKETEFQKQFKEEYIDELVNYQNREDTRFKDILPLFKLDSKSPFTEKTYGELWVNLLLGFQVFYQENFDESRYFVAMKKNTKVARANNASFCPIQYKAIHTPHAMRATFCTHMSEYLERTDIAKLVGHSSPLITSEVYIKPEEDVLLDKIDKAMMSFEQGVNADYFQKGSSAHIQPQNTSSPLQKAFAVNKEETIELFKIQAISMSLDDLSEQQTEKALKLLKDARMDHVLFEQTHICPVGGQCPTEVMHIIVQKRRCGLCPLALKCVDNLNPIYAKQRDLIKEVHQGKQRIEKMISDNQGTVIIDELEEKLNLDIQELVSWRFISEILSTQLQEMKNTPDLMDKYHVEQPEMVKKHLIKVSVSSEREYLLTRIADAQAYTKFDTVEIQRQAELLKRQIVRSLKLVEKEDYEVSDNQRVENLCSLIFQIMKNNKMDLKQLSNYDQILAIGSYKEPKVFDDDKKLLFIKENGNGS